MLLDPSSKRTNLPGINTIYISHGRLRTTRKCSHEQGIASTSQRAFTETQDVQVADFDWEYLTTTNDTNAASEIASNIPGSHASSTAIHAQRPQLIVATRKRV